MPMPDVPGQARRGERERGSYPVTRRRLPAPKDRLCPDTTVTSPLAPSPRAPQARNASAIVFPLIRRGEIA